MNIYFTMELHQKRFTTAIKRYLTNKWFLSIVPLTFLFAFVLFSFRPKMIANDFQKNISFELNEKTWESVKIADASITVSQQTQDIFAKTLNITGIDYKGTSIAISVFDVQNANVGQCLTIGKYFGQEHEAVQSNFTFDIGMASFSNKSNLIFQSSDEKILSSRNGFVMIENCMNGKISGSFEFKTDSGEIFSKGKFVDVMFDFSK